MACKMNVSQMGPTTAQRTTRTCLMQAKFVNSLRIPNSEALSHLKKRIHLYGGETRTSKEELEEEMSRNMETITKLRHEINEKRLAAICPGASEYLMRTALKNHHDGASVFREKEPRDINEQVDSELSDLVNKLNNFKHTRKKRSEHLENILVVFNDAVEDVVFLELEGPMGDTRCLSLENCVGDMGKKYLEAESLQHTYKHIRDQLEIERQTNDTSILTVEKRLKMQESELSACEQTLHAARDKKESAITTCLKTEVDNYMKRKERGQQSVSLRKQTEEQKHDFNQLRKTIQSHFAKQEVQPLHSVISNQSNLDNSDISAIDDVLQQFEHEAEPLQQATGSHSIQELVKCYETQQGTYEHLQSMAKELETRKSLFLSRLESLSVTREESLYHDQFAEDAPLRAASDVRARLAADGGRRRWSSLAAACRVTQTLCRLRQMLEYVVGALAAAGVLTSPPARQLDSVDTVHYLGALMGLAAGGIGRLMATLGSEEPETALRRAAAARFTLTRSEERMSAAMAPTLAAAGATDEGDTTGDDVVVAGREPMKRQARLLVQAKIKAGFGKKRQV